MAKTDNADRPLSWKTSPENLAKSDNYKLVIKKSENNCSTFTGQSVEGWLVCRLFVPSLLDL